MFGAFRFTNPLSSGLLWKTPWRLSKFQKRRQRLRLRAVDSVVATLDSALAKKGETTKSVERWKAEMPKEEEMRAKDKYTIFDRKEKRYRKGIHSMSSRIEDCLGVGMQNCLLWVFFSLADLSVPCRTAQMDESIATTEPSWILGEGTRKILSLENVEARYAGHHIAVFFAEYEGPRLNMVTKHTMEGCG